MLSRLQGVLSTFGCLIPPMCGMVYAWVSQQVSKGAVTADAAEDLWSLDDIDTILKNFTLAMTIRPKWQSWAVDRKNYRHLWLL
ncbi:MAG: hypothetical protein H7256_07255 [Bdellovibrio sp.]|nr:hypothetical protein [Bdellovibrio sp.]